jgi:hypothetical protein
VLGCPTRTPIKGTAGTKALGGRQERERGIVDGHMKSGGGDHDELVRDPSRGVVRVEGSKVLRGGRWETSRNGRVEKLAGSEGCESVSSRFWIFFLVGF